MTHEKSDFTTSTSALQHRHRRMMRWRTNVIILIVS